MVPKMDVLPGREPQAPVQQTLQRLYPSLQAEFPGSSGILPALSFSPLPKVQELGLKMGKETTCRGFSV